MSEVSLSPKQRYLADLERDGFVADASQAAAVDLLEDLYERLVVQDRDEQRSTKRLRAKLPIKILRARSREPEQGL